MATHYMRVDSGCILHSCREWSVLQKPVLHSVYFCERLVLYPMHQLRDRSQTNMVTHLHEPRGNLGSRCFLVRRHVAVSSAVQEDANERDLSRGSFILSTVHQAVSGLGLTGLVVGARWNN